MRSRWRLKDQAVLFKRLSSLLDKGYTLNEAITFLCVNEKGTKREDLYRCRSMLSGGESLRKALSELSFHRDVLSYLYFAEQHGDLPFALKESSEILNRKILHFEQLGKILRYPIILIVIVITILTIVQTVITPQFEQLYTSMNIEASLFSTLLLYLFMGFKWFSLAMLLGGIFFVLYYLFIYKKKTVFQQISTLMQIPVVRPLFMMLHSYFFALQLSNLLKGGMSTFDSLKVFEKQPILPFYQMEAKHVIGKLKNGVQLHLILEERGFYEKELLLVILHGQANGQLARELYMYSQIVIEKLEAKLVNLITIIQPTIYTVIGLIVLFVYLSMLLPMYQMMENI